MFFFFYVLIIFIYVTTLNTSYNKISIFQFNNLLLFITKIHSQKQKNRKCNFTKHLAQIIQLLYDKL